MWAVLLEHDRSYLNLEIDSTGRTLFSHASFSMRTEMPILMLEYGANPNDRGFMSSSILGLELQELPIKLIKKLIEKGAKHRSEFLMAVSMLSIAC